MRPSLRNCCAIALALLCCAVFAAGSAAADEASANFSLRPARSDPARPATKGYFILDTTPGTVMQDEVVVRNSGAAVGTVRLFPVDAVTGQNGGSSFPDEGAPRRAVGNWLKLDRTELTLQPGEEQMVPFTLTIPPDATAGQHLGGLVALDTAIKRGAEGTVRIDTQTRMVAAVQVNLPGATVERLTIGGVSAGGPAGTQLLLLDLRNEGNTMIKPVGTVSVADASGATVQELPLKLDTFLPGDTIQYPVAVQRQALAAGTYSATVNLTYGAGGAATYTGDFNITAAQIAQVFPSAAPLAPPPVAAGAAVVPAATKAAPLPWALIVGGVALLVLALGGGIALGRRGRSARVER